ncbi:MAG TPA: DUF58 domain-containing protein [Acidimicrobiales bacterium]|nr:DUF58 domain-containing protein [Acidimicrobiales bacterium]
MLTRRGRTCLVACAVLLIAGRILGVTELFGVLAAVAALLIVSVVRVRGSHVRTSISARLSPEVIEAGQPTVLELFVENTGVAPSPANRLQMLPAGGGRHRILVPRLSPGERATVTIGLDSSRRGRHAIGGYDVVLSDGLGLATERLTSTGSVAYLVRPRIEELPHTLPLSAGLGGYESTHSAAERILTGASMLRGYVPGDDLRRIHWPTTARVGELMVREGGDPDFSRRSGTTIVLGTNRGGGDAFERAVEIAASLATVATREGQLRLLTTGGYDSEMSDGPAHLESITVQLATLQPADAPLPSRHRRSAPGDPRPEASPEASPEEHPMISRLTGRGWMDDLNVLITVEAAKRPAEAELNPDVLTQLPPGVGTIVLVLVGSEDPRFERLARNEIAVYLPVGRAIHDLWNMALDLPIGESRSLDVISDPASAAGRLPEAV